MGSADRECECGASFTPRSAVVTWCSNRCRSRMYRRAVRAGALVPATRPSSLECAHCGVVFVPKSSRSRFCSSRCQRLSKGRPCRICGKPCQVSSGSLAEPAHDACRSAQHGTEYQYQRGCRCDECRAAVTARVRRWRAGYEERNGRGYWTGRERPWRDTDEKKVWGTCEQCGADFFGFGMMFCSRACHGRSRALVQTTDLVIAPRPPRPTWVGSSVSRGWTFVSGPCAWCGTHFTIAHQTSSRYCSRQCGKSAAKAERRRLRGGFSISPRDRRAIYERDGWVCQLCGDPIDRDAHYQGDYAPSLDHIECQSWVLIPDHSLRNLRTAHRYCNAVRSNRW